MAQETGMPDAPNAAKFQPDYTPEQLESLGVYDALYRGQGPRLASLGEWKPEWISEHDPKGWAQWYKRYASGRRIPEEDERQMKRWASFKARHGSSFAKNPTPRRGWALRNWGIDPAKMVEPAAQQSVSEMLEEYQRKAMQKHVAEKAAAETAMGGATLSPPATPKAPAAPKSFTAPAAPIKPIAPAAQNNSQFTADALTSAGNPNDPATQRALAFMSRANNSSPMPSQAYAAGHTPKFQVSENAQSWQFPQMPKSNSPAVGAYGMNQWSRDNYSPKGGLGVNRQQFFDNVQNQLQAQPDPAVAKQTYTGHLDNTLKTVLGRNFDVLPQYAGLAQSTYHGYARNNDPKYRQQNIDAALNGDSFPSGGDAPPLIMPPLKKITAADIGDTSPENADKWRFKMPISFRRKHTGPSRFLGSAVEVNDNPNKVELHPAAPPSLVAHHELGHAEQKLGPDKEEEARYNKGMNENVLAGMPIASPDVAFNEPAAVLTEQMYALDALEASTGKTPDFNVQYSPNVAPSAGSLLGAARRHGLFSGHRNMQDLLNTSAGQQWMGRQHRDSYTTAAKTQAAENNRQMLPVPPEVQHASGLKPQLVKEQIPALIQQREAAGQPVPPAWRAAIGETKLNDLDDQGDHYQYYRDNLEPIPPEVRARAPWRTDSGSVLDQLPDLIARREAIGLPVPAEWAQMLEQSQAREKQNSAVQQAAKAAAQRTFYHGSIMPGLTSLKAMQPSRPTHVKGVYGADNLNWAALYALAKNHRGMAVVGGETPKLLIPKDTELLPESTVYEYASDKYTPPPESDPNIGWAVPHDVTPTKAHIVKLVDHMRNIERFDDKESLRKRFAELTKQSALLPEVQLQEHQKRIQDAVDDENPRMIVYHGLGSGKSLSALAAAEAAKQKYNEDYGIVAPASLRGNFQKEVEKFTTGSKPEIMSYTGLGLGKKFINQPKTVIMDEAHRLRNPGGSAAQAAKGVAENAKRLLLLTGSPITNSPSDLANLISLVARKNISPQEFERRYVGYETVHPGLINFLAGVKPGVRPVIKNEGELKNLLTGHVDYQASKTPEGVNVNEEKITVPLSGTQQKIQKALRTKIPPGFLWKLDKEFPMSKDELAKLNSFLTGLRQNSVSPQPFRADKDTFKAFQQSGKLQEAYKRLRVMLDEDPRKKAIIYSNHIGAGLDPYSAALNKYNVPHGVFHGGIPMKVRQQSLKDYNEGKLRALLIGPAGAEGLSTKGTNLIQLLDPHWHESRTQQARGRGLRFDSHDDLPEELKNVAVQRFISKSDEPSFLGKLMGYRRERTGDEILERLAKEKEVLNERFRQLLREVGTQKKTAAYKFGASAGKTAGKLGLWDRIRAKKERGGKPASPGDKDYPDAKSWKKVTSIGPKKAAAPQAVDMNAAGVPQAPQAPTPPQPPPAPSTPSPGFITENGMTRVVGTPPLPPQPRPTKPAPLPSSLMSNKAELKPGPVMVHGGIKSPEDTIRDGVKSMTGYDIPALSFSGPGRDPSQAATLFSMGMDMYNNGLMSKSNAAMVAFGKEAGFRWYKRFPMTENLALNLSLGGPSLTVKKLIPGTSMTFGKRAPRMYIGTPIPGLAYQQYLSPKKHKVTAEKEFKDDPDDQRTTYEKIRDFLFGSEYGSAEA